MGYGYRLPSGGSALVRDVTVGFIDMDVYVEWRYLGCDEYDIERITTRHAHLDVDFNLISGMDYRRILEEVRADRYGD